MRLVPRRVPIPLACGARPASEAIFWQQTVPSLGSSSTGGTDAGNGGQQPDLFSEDLTLGDKTCDLTVERGDLLAEQFDHGCDGLRDAGLAGAVTMQLFGFAHVDRLPEAAQEVA